jgi:hypothetical protein
VFRKVLQSSKNFNLGPATLNLNRNLHGANLQLSIGPRSFVRINSRDRSCNRLNSIVLLSWGDVTA